MTIYNVLECYYDCDERYCHDGDPLIYLECYNTEDKAQRRIADIIKKYTADIDDDGEPQTPYECEHFKDMVVLTNECCEITITIERRELH